MEPFSEIEIPRNDKIQWFEYYKKQKDKLLDETISKIHMINPMLDSKIVLKPIQRNRMKHNSFKQEKRFMYYNSQKPIEKKTLNLNYLKDKTFHVKVNSKSPVVRKLAFVEKTIESKGSESMNSTMEFLVIKNRIIDKYSKAEDFESLDRLSKSKSLSSN